MKYFTTLCFFSLLLIVTAITIQARDSKQIKVFIDDKSMLQALSEMSLDIIERGDTYITIITNSTELEEIKQKGFRVEIEHEDVVDYYQKQIHGKNFIEKATGIQDMGGYKTLTEINAAVDTIIANHPSIISNKVVIGQSVEGRDIWAVKISDNPNIDEDEIEIFYYSATHSREVITPEVLLHFMNHLTDNYGTDPEITDIVDNREIWFLLNVNPDGYVHNQVIEPAGGGLWRKNRRDNGDGTFGVDINRNYGFKWGLDDNGSSPDPVSETYRGTGPFSEPETQVMRDFVEAHKFVICVDYHSYSDLFLWPWGYDYLYTEDENVFSLLGDSVSAYNGYSTGPGWTLYLVNGEAGDWMYGEQTTKNKNLHVLFEVGSPSDGFWPNPADIPTLVAENLGPNIFLAKIAGDIYQRVPPKTPSIIVDNLVDSISYDVNWVLNDTMNPALEYELVELQGYNADFDSASNFDKWSNSGFSISTSEFNSLPSSFYSNSGNNLFTTMTTIEPFFVDGTDSIQFYTKYSIESDWDYAYLSVSTDGINYTTIEGDITTNSNPNGNNLGNGITGSSGGVWVLAHFNISSYTGQNIFIRLTYSTDGFVIEDGFRVDDFYPTVSFATTTVVASAIVDTFLTFTDKPIGAYYYKVRGKDAENQWSKFSETQKTNVISAGSTCYTAGDIDNDGLSLSVADVLFLTRYLDGTGPAPDTLFYADMNGDCVITPADLVMYEDYITNGLSVFPEYPIPTCCNVNVDRDGDGVLDSDEILLGTNMFNVDSDGDSIDDLAEVGDVLNPLNTDGDALIDALDPDDDGDSVPTLTEATNGDTDNDGIPDYLDSDDDNDGVLTIDDNCPLVVNPLQADSDSDGFGDACDPCCIAVRGNVNGGPDDGTLAGSVSIADIVFLVAYMFQGGAVPVCEAEANIDGLGNPPINITDLVTLVAFMFQGGAPPAPCF